MFVIILLNSHPYPFIYDEGKIINKSYCDDSKIVKRTNVVDVFRKEEAMVEKSLFRGT